MKVPSSVNIIVTLALANVRGSLAGSSKTGVELSTFLPPESVSNAFFGGAIAVSNNVVIGASVEDEGDGSVSIYEKGNSASESWPGTSVYPPDGATADGFGVSVAIASYSDGMVAFVGAPKDSTSGVDTGCVYVYQRKGSWWEYIQRLTGSNMKSGDRFGASLAVSDDRLIVGAHYGDSEKGTDSGRAFIFVRSAATGQFAYKQELVRNSAYQRPEDFYGRSVSIDGDIAVVGAYGTDNSGESSGSAFVFTYSSSSGQWTQEATLVSGDPTSLDYFGYSVSVSGKYALIGAFGADSSTSGMQSGAAYLFVRNKKGVWKQIQKIVSDDGNTEDQFGATVALGSDGATALISARADDDNGDESGSVYLFNSKSSDLVKLNQVGKLLSSDGAAGDWFGYSIGLEDDMAVVGAPLKDSNSGEAYLFQIPTGTIGGSSSSSDDNATLAAGLVVLSLVILCVIAIYVLRSRGMLPDKLELALMSMESSLSTCWSKVRGEGGNTDSSTNTKESFFNKEPYNPLDKGAVGV